MWRFIALISVYLSIEERMKKKENTKQKNGIIGRIVTVIVVIAVIALAAAGLWYLSGEGKKPADQLVFTVGGGEVSLDEINLCIF